MLHQSHTALRPLAPASRFLWLLDMGLSLGGRPVGYWIWSGFSRRLARVTMNEGFQWTQGGRNFHLALADPHLPQGLKERGVHHAF